MPKKRTKVHLKYFRVRGYQIIRDISDEKMAKELSCSIRTYRDKVHGWNDFSSLEARRVSEILNESQDILFFTIDVLNSEHSA